MTTVLLHQFVIGDLLSAQRNDNLKNKERKYNSYTMYSYMYDPTCHCFY